MFIPSMNMWRTINPSNPIDIMAQIIPISPNVSLLSLSDAMKLYENGELYRIQG